MESWFRGPFAGGLVDRWIVTNGCFQEMHPLDGVGADFLTRVHGAPIFVLKPGSRFAGYGLRESRQRFCLVRFNLAFDDPDVALDMRFVPQVAEALEWALDVFERHGVQISPRPSPEPAKQDWRWWVSFFRRKYEGRRTYHPQFVKEELLRIEDSPRAGRGDRRVPEAPDPRRETARPDEQPARPS